MENIILKPKGEKKPTKIKKEITQLRQAEALSKFDATSLDSTEKTLDEAASAILKKLKFFQDRAHEKNPIKARAHRRLVFGLREINRDINLLKAVVIARDIDCTEDGTTELSKLVEQIKEKCKESGVPCVKALTKSKLSKIKNSRKVGAMGIYNFEGAEALFQEMIDAALKTQNKHED